MRVFRSLDEAAAGFAHCALTVGNFDGVHAGHRSILRRVVELARARGLAASVLTFHPHPTRVVAPARAPRLMLTPEQRVECMAALGVDQVLILPFTAELAQLTPGQFVADVLVRALRVRAVLVGDNFRFGHRQAGTVAVLRELGDHAGFDTEIVPAVTRRGRVVSSSAIRDLIGAGRVTLAGRLLERAYSLDGAVVTGRGVGSKQTVPTLNLATDCEVLPATGVYVTRTLDLDDFRAWQSITNIGYRPTFGASDALSIETFLLQPLAGETPRAIRVEFLWRARGEHAFESPEALKRQILRDAGRAQAWFRRTEAWVKRTPDAS